jgi:hypothetical protein
MIFNLHHILHNMYVAWFSHFSAASIVGWWMGIYIASKLQPKRRNDT